AAAGVVKQSECSRGRIDVSGVEKESVYSVGRVLVSRRVAIECINTVGRIIGTSGVQRQRINADGRVEVPDSVTFERRETNCSVVCAAGETQKGVLPFCRVATG